MNLARELSLMRGFVLPAWTKYRRMMAGEWAVMLSLLVGGRLCQDPAGVGILAAVYLVSATTFSAQFVGFSAVGGITAGSASGLSIPLFLRPVTTRRLLWQPVLIAAAICGAAWILFLVVALPPTRFTFPAGTAYIVAISAICWLHAFFWIAMARTCGLLLLHLALLGVGLCGLNSFGSFPEGWILGLYTALSCASMALAVLCSSRARHHTDQGTSGRAKKKRSEKVPTADLAPFGTPVEAQMWAERGPGGILFKILLGIMGLLVLAEAVALGVCPRVPDSQLSWAGIHLTAGTYSVVHLCAGFMYFPFAMMFGNSNQGLNTFVTPFPATKPIATWQIAFAKIRVAVSRHVWVVAVVTIASVLLLIQPAAYDAKTGPLVAMLFDRFGWNCVGAFVLFVLSVFFLCLTVSSGNPLATTRVRTISAIVLPATLGALYFSVFIGLWKNGAQNVADYQAYIWLWLGAVFVLKLGTAAYGALELARKRLVRRSALALGFIGWSIVAAAFAILSLTVVRSTPLLSYLVAANAVLLVPLNGPVWMIVNLDRYRHGDAEFAIAKRLRAR